VQSRIISISEGRGGTSLRAETKLLIERRDAVRYVVGLGVEFRWADRGGKSKEGKGYTRDVSPKGAYISSAEGPPVGAKLQIAFELSNDVPGLQPLGLDAEGTVLRVEPTSGKPGNRGFAVQMRRTRVLTR
jgi:PilZ domain